MSRAVRKASQSIAEHGEELSGQGDIDASLYLSRKFTHTSTTEPHDCRF